MRNTCQKCIDHFINSATLTDRGKQGRLTEVSDVPQGVDGGMTFVEDNEKRRAGDTFCQILTVQILPAQIKKSHCSFFQRHWTDCNSHFDYNVLGGLKMSSGSGDLLHVKLHPVLQLLRDVLLLPLSQVCHNDSWVEGACVGFHGQLLDGLLLKVKEAHVVILLVGNKNQC